jgi:hypothetical protein
MNFGETPYYKNMERVVGEIMIPIVRYDRYGRDNDYHVGIIDDFRNYGDPLAELKTYLTEDFTAAPPAQLAEVEAKIVAFWSANTPPETW